MDDEYKVGVHLLVEDGVSEALAGIKDQLAAADQAIAVTAANWEGLRFAVDLPHSPILAEPAPAVPKPQIEPPRELPPDAGENPTSRLEPILVPAVAASLPLVPVPRELLAPPQTGPDRLVASPPTSALSGWPIAPNMLPVLTNNELSSSPILHQQVAVPEALQIAPVPRLLDNELGVPGSAAVAPILSDITGPATPATAPVETGLMSALASAPFAPMLVPQSESVAPKDTALAVSAGSASDMAPAGGAAADMMSTVPMADADGAEGQLMLDGNLLGRWVIEHLGQEAARAPIGGIAFDPRQAREWA